MVSGSIVGSDYSDMVLRSTITCSLARRHCTAAPSFFFFFFYLSLLRRLFGSRFVGSLSPAGRQTDYRQKHAMRGVE